MSYPQVRAQCSPQWAVGPRQPSRCLPAACCLPRGPGDQAGAACTCRPLHLHGKERRWHGPKTPPPRGARYARLPGVPLPAPLAQLGGPAVGNASLPLTEPPALKPLPGMVMVMVNASAVLACEVTGVPRPEVTWQKDGVGVAGGEREPAGGWQSPCCPPAFVRGEIWGL